MIPIKTPSEIEKMAEIGATLAEIFNKLAGMLKAGIATIDLDREAVCSMAELGVTSAFKGYNGYPANICVSVNEEVIHGIPGSRRILDGDIVSIDIGIKSDGFFADMAKTFAVGEVSEDKQRLIDAARDSLEEAIRQMKPGNRLSDVSCAVQNYAEARNFSVVRDFVGHGIGHMLHEEPPVPNFGERDTGPVLEDGMVLAIEPMINLGGWEVVITEDGWTAVTKDLKPSAHFEHTVAIWNGAPRILTQVK